MPLRRLLTTALSLFISRAISAPILSGMLAMSNNTTDEVLWLLMLDVVVVTPSTLQVRVI